jgi:hypothetical protein
MSCVNVANTLSVRLSETAVEPTLLISGEAFALWERTALSQACHELAARRTLELAVTATVREPLKRAFAEWREWSLDEAKQELYSAISLVEAHPLECKHSAFAGAIALALNSKTTDAQFLLAFHHHNKSAPLLVKSRRAFDMWRRETRKTRGAQVVAVLLAAARDALLAAALEHWSSAARRTKQLEFRLWKKIVRSNQ